MSPQMRKGERARPNLAQLAGMGAISASGGILLAMLAFLFFTRPGATVMDGENVAITWIGVGGLFLALIGVHILLGRRLIALGKGVRRMP